MVVDDGRDILERNGYGPVSISEPRRYTEGTIEPGAEGYVLGGVREENSSPDERDDAPGEMRWRQSVTRAVRP